MMVSSVDAGTRNPTQTDLLIYDLTVFPD